MTVRPPSLRTSRAVLILAAVLTVVLWQIPGYGQLLLYPFTLLSTYAHEMGHGVTALVLGADFHRLLLFADGSGLASWGGDVGRVGRALVAAGGLVGPSVAGATLLALSRSPARARPLLYALAGAMGLSLLVAGSAFTILFVAAVAAALFLVARRASRGWASFTVQLLGVQLCVALFQDIHYMFSPGGIVGGRAHSSDSAAMADALFLPYWFWGGLTAAFSAAVLAWGLWRALRSEPAPETARRL